jgi:polysaccharide export outer membrane protein
MTYLSNSFRSFFILSLTVSFLFCLGGCVHERVDPGYLALVEQQEKQEGPVAGSLGPGDKFQIRVHEEQALSGAYTVSSDGTINYPHIGRINVEGMTCGQVERVVTKGLADGYLRKPSVSCSIGEYNSKKVFVFGEVKKPGSYPYKTNLTVVDVFALAGGFTERASSNETKLTRQLDSVEVQVRIPMQEIVEGRRKNLDLLPGDIVFVPQSPY